MLDLPVDIPTDAIGRISFANISETVTNLEPIMSVIRHTWSTQTLAEITDGKVSVPDEVINESLARYTNENSHIYNINVTSLGENKLRLVAQTKKFGAIDFICRIDQFEHNKDISLLKFTVLEKDLPEHEVLSWIISRVSLSMVEKMVGRIELGDTIKTKIVHDTVAIDFHDALNETEFGKSNLFGYKVSDALVIENAVPKDGYIEFKTSLDMPETVKRMLYNILK